MRMQLSRALSLLLLASACATTKAPAKLAVGDALEFELPNLEGARVSPKDMAGKVVLVDLWATWCKPCKVSLPFYSALYQQHEKEGFEVVAISVDVHREEV